MPTNVKGSSLAVGDVIQDSAATSDTHPYVVVSRSQWYGFSDMGYRKVGTIKAERMAAVLEALAV